MRIVGGYARGIRLLVPGGDEIRPTEDRVKETMFSVIGNLTGKRVLDLYSGTGALGLEALSRGASEVIMVERNPRHVAVIEKNLAAVLKSIGDRPVGEVRIISSDVRKAWKIVRNQGFAADLILADPPYDPPAGVFGGKDLLASQEYASLAAPDCLFVFEYRTGTELPWAPLGPWRSLRVKTAGIRSVAFARLAANFPEDDLA